jgi:RNA polymerase-binding transcription factor DksA
MRNDIDTNAFKVKLEEELKLIEGELSNIGQVNPEVSVSGQTDWEVKSPTNMDIDEADETEVADKFEEMQENTAVIDELEGRYNGIKAALQRIEEGTYGVCKVCGQPIEADRLEANPAAETCKAHML